MMRLRAFGRQVADAQDEALRESPARAGARARLLLPGPTSRAPQVDRRPTLAWAAVGAVFAAAACILALWPSRGRGAALLIDVGPSDADSPNARPEHGTVGEWIAAPGNGNLPVRFSDGSLLRLAPTSRARVVELATNGASVIIERGALHATVVHRPDTRWNVEAGPFRVRVTGTAFDVGWDPLAELFTITLEQGSVAVSGCSLGQERIITAGETFRATCKEGQVAAGSNGPPSPNLSATPSSTSLRVAAPPAPQVAVAPPPGPLSPSLHSPGRVMNGSGQRRIAESWHDLVMAGRYREAVDAADAMGLASVCADTDASSLMDLGDAARFAGRSDRAEIIYRELRTRFMGDERASTAAFYLGRISFDDKSAYADAARWFGIYLSERPSGSLAREASGRLVEALERGGDHARAREAAKRYLADFADGPHARMARSIADR